MSFDPSNSLLVERTEQAINISALVKYVPDNVDRVIGYDFRISPQSPHQFTITTSLGGVEIFSPHLLGFFEPLELKLKDIKTNTLHEFKRWEFVPKGLNTVSFKPPKLKVVFILSVTVHVVVVDPITLVDGECISHQKDYQIVITPHYSTGREELLNYEQIDR